MAILTCNCNKLRELKRNIELRHQANECLANGKIIYTQNLDSLSIVKIEGFANQVKVWNSEAEFFPWEDVALSIFQNPEGMNFESGICEHCNSPIVSIHFISPQWTWEHLCGRAGRLSICPICKAQIDFKLELMN